MIINSINKTWNKVDGREEVPPAVPEHTRRGGALREAGVLEAPGVLAVPIVAGLAGPVHVDP